MHGTEYYNDMHTDKDIEQNIIMTLTKNSILHK